MIKRLVVELALSGEMIKVFIGYSDQPRVVLLF